MGEYTDLRCDIGKLHARLKSEGKKPVLADGNLIEFSCRECRKRMVTDERGELPTAVLHRFNVLGRLVETEVVWT